ncbi:MAG: hypothetical protein JWR52_690 [Marmoricola sp.]|nr:hypothetical protein [Marmoricola sp.]
MRYWDGSRWTEQRFQTPEDPYNHPVGAGFGRLAHAIRVGLGLSVAVLVAEIMLYSWGLSMFDNAVATGDLDSLNLFDT